MFRLIVLLMFAAAGCGHRTLPKLVGHRLSPDLPYCEALPEPEPSQLHDLIDEVGVPDDHTGVLLLERGASALIARAWLVQHAVTQIDAQYFIFAADTAGIVATDALLRAAERGVRVRLLVDDTLAHGDPKLLRALSLHPNAEVRIYNPVINVGVPFGQKIKNVFGEFKTVNQRMHNKLFIADQQVAITGGRNVGGEYFDLANHHNFRDRDVLMVNGEVDQAQRSFNSFWEHPLSRPIETLLERPVRYSPDLIWEKLHQFSCNPENFLPMLRSRIAAVPESLRERIEDGQLHLTPRVHYISDEPHKNKSTTLTGGGTATDALIELVEGAEHSVVIQTPYLVTTELSQSLFRAAEDRGVRVQILTNSLASTDNLLAFSGYQRGQKQLLDAGVELYESKPKMNAQSALMNGPLEPRYQSSMALHAKSMVVDGTVAVVGSFNLDPRSANLNTESVTVIHSEVVAQHLLERMKEEMTDGNAWQRTDSYNPDKHAPRLRRVRVALSSFVPLSVL